MNKDIIIFLTNKENRNTFPVLHAFSLSIIMFLVSVTPILYFIISYNSELDFFDNLNLPLFLIVFFSIALLIQSFINLLYTNEFSSKKLSYIKEFSELYKTNKKLALSLLKIYFKDYIKNVLKDISLRQLSPTQYIYHTLRNVSLKDIIEANKNENNPSLYPFISCFGVYYDLYEKKSDFLIYYKLYNQC